MILRPSSNYVSKLIDSDTAEPMQVDAIKRSISTQEKERRRSENICLYCGDSWHYAVNCPNKVRRTIAATDVIVPELINSIT